MTNKTSLDAIDLAARVMTWPTVADLAARTGINGRLLRRAIQDGELPALRLDFLRVNPEDFAAWLAARRK